MKEEKVVKRCPMPMFGICPECGKKAYVSDDYAGPDSGGMGGHCNACGYSWSNILY